MEMKPCIYTLASGRNSSLYIGVTSNIRRRLMEHHLGHVAHTREHRIGRLVYLEPHESIVAAIACEKVLKNSDGLENSIDRSG